MKKRILAIGAYERDNFGDLLFFQVLKEYLSDCTVIAGSIMYSDMTETLGEKVLPYPILLKKYSWDTVWVVGGEVGGVDIDAAYNMSLSPEQLRVYSNLSSAKKRVIQKAYSGNSVPDTAYLPDKSLFSELRQCKLIINSVGISNIEKLQNAYIAKRSLTILKEAHQLTVRDKKSAIYCRKNNISSQLIPDVVHSIGRMDNWIALKKQVSNKSPYITFQMNQGLLRSYNRYEVARILVSIIKKYKVKIIMVAAGIAAHHDSYAEYHHLKMLVGREVGKENIEVLLSRKPSVIVERIINSMLWVGTSLHGRIVASSFHVPRISLTNEKVDSYAETWDHHFPSNVMLQDVPSIIGEVLNKNYHEAHTYADSVSEMAESNLKRLKESIA